MSPAEYLSSIEFIFRTGKASEHSYRSAFATLVESRAREEITALNDPKREKCGAPDYAVFRKRGGLTIGWIKTKDFGLRVSLPLLRDFFGQITGARLDDEPFAGFVEDIIQTLGHADIDAVLRAPPGVAARAEKSF
jgi:hypothetical protein